MESQDLDILKQEAQQNKLARFEDEIESHLQSMEDIILYLENRAKELELEEDLKEIISERFTW